MLAMWRAITTVPEVGRHFEEPQYAMLILENDVIEVGNQIIVKVLP